MHTLMHVWDCPGCGERLDDEINYNAEVIDPVSDRVEHLHLCSSCGHEVTQRKSNGIPVMAEVSEERAEFFRLDVDPDDPDDDDDYVDTGEDDEWDDVEDLMDADFGEDEFGDDYDAYLERGEDEQTI